MSTSKFYILDVFAESRYAGNQLAVVRDCETFSDAEMQTIAQEMNYSETTFILSEEPHDGGYNVRIFTPRVELPFAGHPTLGTAYLIQQEILKKNVDQVILNLQVGQIPVKFHYKDDIPDIIWMNQVPPSFGEIIDKDKIAESLNIDVSDIDERFPVREVSTGTPVIIAPLKSLPAVKKSFIDKGKFFKLIETLQAKAILIFSPETYDRANDLNARFFADYLGVAEDPATGSAAGCLAGYLSEYKYFGKEKIDIKVEQGYEIDRHSLLYLKSEKLTDKIDVHVGGKVFMVASGELFK